jgi:hypothetical protein
MAGPVWELTDGNLNTQRIFRKKDRAGTEERVLIVEVL